jgi:F0F1-type ATP synthase beta subunit
VRDRIGLAALTLAESFCDQGRETLLFMEENLVSDQNGPSASWRGGTAIRGRR